MKRLFFTLLLAFFGLTSGLIAQRGQVLGVTPVFDLSAEQTQDQINALSPIQLEPFLLNLLTDIDYGVLGLRVQYETIDVAGNPTTASGLVVVPNDSPCPQDLMVYCHGTIFDKDAAPSDVSPFNPVTEVLFGLLYGGNGYLTVLPDYLGLGEGSPGFHLFVNEQTEASATIDLMQAARNLANATNVPLTNKAFISGYSQGGHAGMSTFKALQAAGGAGFDLKSAGLGSGPYDLSTTQYNYIINDPNYPEPEFILYVIASAQTALQTIFPNNPNKWIYEDPEEFLINEEAPNNYADLYTSEILGQTGNRDWVPIPYTDMFRPGFLQSVLTKPNKPVRQYLAANDVFDWINRKPTSMYYCTQDEKVDFRSSLRAEAAFEDNLPWYLFWMRALINSIYIGPLDHGDCVIPYALLSKAKFDFSQSHCYNAKAADSPPAAKVNYTVAPINYYWLDVQTDATVSKLEFLRMDGSLAATFTDLRPVDGRIRIDVRDLERMAYALRFTAPNGKVTHRLTALDEVKVLRHAQYNPLSYDRAAGTYSLDLSLLLEPVQTLTIYDRTGNLLGEIDAAGASDQFTFAAAEVPGSATMLELQTREHSFFLPIDQTAPDRASDGLAVYPNPTDEWVTLRLDRDDQIRSVVIYDAQGRTVWQQHQVNNRQLTTTVDLPAGLYEVQVLTLKDEILTEKLMVIDR